jgi:hypothetical protein
MAIETGTSLDPEHVPDHGWFEKRIGNFISRALKGLRERDDLGRAVTVVTRLQETIGIFGRELDLEDSLSLLQRLKSFGHEVAVTTKVEVSPSLGGLKNQRCLHFLEASFVSATLGCTFIADLRVRSSAARRYEMNHKRAIVSYIYGSEERIQDVEEFLQRRTRHHMPAAHVDILPLAVIGGSR